jgi:hypothetical protein
MLQSFKFFGCFMGLTINFLNWHLHCFPHNLGAVSEQQAERFHPQINETEGRCQVGRMLTWRWLPADGTARSDGMLTSEGERRRQQNNTVQGHWINFNLSILQPNCF